MSAHETEPSPLLEGKLFVKELDAFEAHSHESIIAPFAKVTFITTYQFIKASDLKRINASDWEIRSTRIISNGNQLEICLQKHLSDF